MESLKSIVTNFVKQLNAISEYSNIGLKAYQTNLDEFERELMNAQSWILQQF